MRKYIFIIFILIISIIFSFQYLSKIIHSKKAYPFEPSDHAFLLQKKDISIYEEDAFVFEDYFEIYTKGRPSYNYRFQDGEISLTRAFLILMRSKKRRPLKRSSTSRSSRKYRFLSTQDHHLLQHQNKMKALRKRNMNKSISR